MIILSSQISISTTYVLLHSLLCIPIMVSASQLYGVTAADSFGNVDFVSIDSGTGQTTFDFQFNVGAGNQVGAMTYHPSSGRFITVSRLTSGNALGFIDSAAQSFSTVNIVGLPGTVPIISGIAQDMSTNQLFVSFAEDGSNAEDRIAQLALDGTVMAYTSDIANDIDALGFRSTTNQLLGFDLNANSDQRIFDITGLFASPSVNTIATPPRNNDIGDVALDPDTGVIFTNGFNAAGGSLLRLDGDTTYLTVGDYGATRQINGIAFVPLPASTVTYISHQGATEPLMEGWSNVYYDGNNILTSGNVSPGVVVDPVTGDMGFNAWQVDDNSTASFTNGGYAYELSATELETALSNGFRLTTRLRVVDTLDAVEGSISVHLSTGSTRWQMLFGSDDNGDPTVTLADEANSKLGPSFTLEGSGGGYHLYDLLYDPVSATASLFVDGVERLTGYDGRPFSEIAPYLFWGSAQDNDTGKARYNLVELSLSMDCPSLSLDIDGNGKYDALSDGILAIRYLFGFRGDTLISNAIAPDCTRCTAPEIESCLQELTP